MSLRSIIMTVKQPSVTAEFLKSVVGLTQNYQTESMVELNSPSISSGPPIIIKASSNVATLATGYSPILNFDIANMETSITKAIELGGMLDGTIKYKSFGKIAAVRSPDGHVIGLFEPVVDSANAD
jgi:hypothetical protein